MNAQSIYTLPWKGVRGVIFDLDGTLYAQQNMRLYMLRQILAHPDRFRIARILYIYRKERSHHRGQTFTDLSEATYQWCRKFLSLSREEFENIYTLWMYKKPLAYIKKCMYVGVPEVFTLLREKRRKIAVFSDYPVREKLQALNLQVDVCCSADDVHALKPHSKGLQSVLKGLALSAQECVYIGNELHRDGQCAAHLKVPFVHIRRCPTYFYKKLLYQLQNL